MAECIAIVGASGKGKSTSILPNLELGIKGLDPKETVLINVAGKALPTRGWKPLFTQGLTTGGNYLKSNDAPKVIVPALDYIDQSRPDIKNIILDDAQYLMAFAFMERAMHKGYDKFSEIAKIGFSTIEKAMQLKRDDLMVFFLYHEEKGDDGELKIKTSGKMLDNHITMEGLFTVVLFANAERHEKSKKTEYFFITNSDGNCKAKSPFGMFKEIHVPNDLGYVRDAINNYNN